MDVLSDRRSDVELLRGSSNNPDDFGLFYDRHVKELLSYCYRRTGCAETAAELTAEVFTAAFSRRRSYRESTTPAIGWLYGIARRQIGTFLRRKAVADRHRKRFGLGDLSWSADDLGRIERLVDLQAHVHSLQGAWHLLSTAQQQAVQLRVVDELSYAEIAEILQCSNGAARVRVSRGLSRLADEMEQNDE